MPSSLVFVLGPADIWVSLSKIYKTMLHLTDEFIFVTISNEKVYGSIIRNVWSIFEYSASDSASQRVIPVNTEAIA